MAHIKCRYYETYCNNRNRDGWYYGMPKIKYEDCKEWSNNCGKGVFKWTDSKTGQEVYSDICRYVYFSESEFEGDFKKYEFDKSELHIPRKYISAAHIIYLEIDNRIIIGEEDKHDI